MDLHLGPYQLLQPAGRGGMSEVWQAVHRQLGLPAAIKIQQVESELLRDAFAGEVRAMARLEHPNVVAVFGHGRVSAEAEAASRGRFAAGTPWLAMEYCSGGTLEGFVPANWNGLRRIFYDLLAALGAAHARGVLHLDLKPENVLIATDQDLRPGRKLTDFGLSFAEQGDTGEVGVGGDDVSVLGTPAWMAPEQFRRQWREYGPWTDLYALGCVGYALATGQPPFGIGRPPEVLMMAHEELPPPRLRARFGVPEGLERWLWTLLEKRPARRFQSAAEALLALQSADGDPPPAGRVARLSGRTEGATDVRVARLSAFGLRRPQIQGRAAERDRLWERLQAVERAGRPEVVVVSGEPGVGKSTLAEWLCERAAETGSAVVLRVGAGEGGGLAGAVRARLRLEGLAGAELAARLADRLPDLSEEERGLLLGLIGAEGDGPEREQAAALGRLAGWLTGGGVRPAPLLLWVDGGLTPARLGTLERLLAAEGAGAALIMLTLSTRLLAANPAEAARLERLPGVVWLALRPMPDAEMRQLLTEGYRLGAEPTALLVERARGNPGYALQAIRDWVQGGLLQPGVDGLHPTAAMGGAPALPGDEQSLWSARLDRALIGAGLDVYAARLALGAGALLGDPFDERDWRAALPLLPHPIPEGLAQAAAEALIQARLLQRGAEGGRGAGGRTVLRFEHPLIREDLLAEAEVAGRARPVRIALARALQQGQDGARPEATERLAALLAASGLEAEALQVLVEAARRAAGERLARLLELAAPMIAALPAEDPRRAEAGLLQARGAHAAGDYEGARAAAARAVEIARAHGHGELLAAALLELADCTRIRGSPSLALALFQEAQSIHRRQGDRAGLAVCLAGLGELAGQMGELNQAIRLLHQSAQLSGEAGKTRDQADALRELADTARRAGRLDHAEAWAAEALALYQQLKAPSGVAAVTNIQAATLRQGGRLFPAEALALRALRQFEALESRQVTFPLVNLALIYLLMDRAAEARTLIERAIPALRAQGRQIHEAVAQAALLPCLALAADLPTWDLHFQRLHALIEQTDTIDPDIAEALVISSRALSDPGRRLRDPRRAARGFELARSQWLALGAGARVAEADAALIRLGEAG